MSKSSKNEKKQTAEKADGDQAYQVLLPYTEQDRIPLIVEEARRAFSSGKTKPLSWRREQLYQCDKMLKENETALVDALHKDLGKPCFESLFTELGLITNEIAESLEHLEEWSKPDIPGGVDVAYLFDERIVRKEPYGVVLILGPWNFPLLLILHPLISALAAGNAVIIKPSELAPNTAAILSKLIPSYLDASAVKVIHGSVPETTTLLSQRFDYIFFTGSTNVGRVVMTAAAKHLTPVTLELGGKSPCIVDRNVDLDIVANRIVFGKFMNAGQVCVAIDYLLVFSELVEPLLEAIQKKLKLFYGEDTLNIDNMSHIINKTNFFRINKLLTKELETSGSELLFGGESNEKSLRIQPTAVHCGAARDYLKDGKRKGPLLSEEIFGPIIPILEISSIDEAIDYINADERPLALYLFTNCKSVQNRVLSLTSSGTVAINDALMQLGCPGLPFGGIGGSGMGNYHGKFGFDTFTHQRGTLVRNLNSVEEKLNQLRYHPYTEQKKQILTLLLLKRVRGPWYYYLKSLFGKVFNKWGLIVVLAVCLATSKYWK